MLVAIVSKSFIYLHLCRAGQHTSQQLRISWYLVTRTFAKIPPRFASYPECHSQAASWGVSITLWPHRFELPTLCVEQLPERSQDLQRHVGQEVHGDGSFCSVCFLPIGLFGYPFLTHGHESRNFGEVKRQKTCLQGASNTNLPTPTSSKSLFDNFSASPQKIPKQSPKAPKNHICLHTACYSAHLEETLRFLIKSI